MLQEIWIVIETPGGPGGGTGTQTDPYRVNSATQFDQRMQLLADSPGGDTFHVHLGAGTFKTYGLRHFPTTVPGAGGHAAGINKGGTAGWYVLPGWTITGAGESATTIKLEQWPSFDGTPQTVSDWAVLGCGVDQPASNVLIEHLTVDGNWDYLTSPPGSVALHGAAIVCGGPVRFSHVAAVGFHSSTAPNKRCYGLCTLAVAPLIDFFDGSQATFERCTVHGGTGDDCAGIGAIQYGPSLISNCTIFSLANTRSGAIEVIGRDILITNNFVWNCNEALHLDTGSIVGLQMDNNRFICSGRRVLYADSTVAANEQRVWINVRQGHWEGSAIPARNVSLHGVYVDIPIRPLAGPFAGNPQYRIRVWFSRQGSDTGAPPAPAVGILIKCPFTTSDYLVVGGETLNGIAPEQLESQLQYWLTAYPYQPPTNPALTLQSMDRGAILVVPTVNSERNYDSQAGPFTSDESKVYLQFDEKIRRDWRIRNNYFELPFKLSPTYPDQSFIHFIGNGSSDKDYHFSNNLGRFIGEFFPPGIPTYSVRTKGIGGVTVMDNVFDAETERYGQAEFLKPETPPNPSLPIDTLTKRGNRNLYEKPIQTLLDDFHDWGSQQTLSANNGYPLPGVISFSNSTSGSFTATGVDLRDELRSGDLLANAVVDATHVSGGIGTASGPFYVTSVTSSTTATLNRGGSYVLNTAFSVKRYRGPIAYLSSPPAPAVPQPIFNVLNDGSVAIGGIPANFGFGEFYVNGKATITGQVRAGDGSAATPAVAFTAESGTGFYHPAADTVGLATSGIERARVTSAGLQLGNLIGLGFGTSTTVSDTFLARDDGANRLALRNGAAAQTFRVYENYGSALNYSRLSFNGQPSGNPGAYQIRSEAGGTGTLRSLQVGTGPKTGTNQTGLDTFLHAGQGTGTGAGGAILFQYAPAGNAGSSVNGLQTAWQIGPTGHLTAGDAAKMIKWGTASNFPAIKATSSSSSPDLQIRRGDDSSGAALLFRLSVAPKTMTTYTVNESENNRTFTNEGATGPVTFILPAGYSTNIGFHCHFAVVAGQTVTIRASDSSTIRIGTPITTSTPASINTSTQGNTIHLVCLNSNKWVALSHEGTWSGVS